MAIRSPEKINTGLPTILLSKILIIAFFALLLTLAYNEIHHYNDERSLVMDGIYTEAKGIATYAANSIPWDLHENLNFDDELSEDFLYLHSIINHISESYPRASYVYTAKRDGDSYYFVLDSDEEDPFESWTNIGYPVTVVPDALILAFSGEVTHTDGFYHDEWGSFISGYAPIFSPSGEVVAVLAVDVSEELVNEQIGKTKKDLLIRTTIITIVGLIASFIGIYTTIYLFESHKSTKSAQHILLQATNAAQKGAFEYDALNDTLLCGPETAKLFGYNIEPGIEKYALRKDFLVGKAVYEDKKDIDDTLSGSKNRPEGTKHIKFVHMWKFHIENKIKVIRFKGYIAPTKEGMQIIGMAEDYTEQEKNKSALIKTNEKIQILHSVSSHDIRNISTAIYSYADLILEEEVSESVKADINQLIQSSEDSISTISTFSNIYRTVGTNLPEWIDLRTVVHDIFESTDLKDILFTNNIGNVDIYADQHINFVIETLFEFSIKYCQATSILMYTSISEDLLRIIYEDNGVGLSENNKRAIFDFSLTKTDKNALYIAREILSITDISIKEEKTDESGTRFVITVKPGWFRLRE